MQLYKSCEFEAHPHPNFFFIKASEAYDRICLGIPFGNEPFDNEALLYPVMTAAMVRSHCLECLRLIYFLECYENT